MQRQPAAAATSLASTAASAPPATSAAVDEHEMVLRDDLAAAHWATNHFGMDDLVWNHISARCADGTILITPGEVLWDEVTPGGIVKQSDNSTANVIHEAIYDCGRDDIRAVVHLHTRAAVAISCMEPGSFEFLDQNSTQFLGEIAYHEYEGLSDDAEGEEKRRIAEDMRMGGPKTSVLVMRNHGYCTVGSTVGEAWVRAWYWEKCCQLCLDVWSSGQTQVMPSQAALAKAKQQYDVDFRAGMFEWPAIVRKWRRHTQRENAAAARL